MSIHDLPFQAGLSIPEFFASYGTEARFADLANLKKAACDSKPCKASSSTSTRAACCG
ncbi:hypothetical protein [Xanthomonas albilineans]|uniref:hypothetical protein n=1 Tax=Xanthomonas albilineans TaxID=29447 RepID=UPI000B097647|nr:hypothetical protein [Xanthomonas albilineans]